MKKNILALTLVVAMSLFIFVGCGDKTVPEDDLGKDELPKNESVAADANVTEESEPLIFEDQEYVYSTFFDIGQLGQKGLYFDEEEFDQGINEVQVWSTKADITHDGLNDLIVVDGYSLEDNATIEDVLSNSSYGCYVKVYRAISETEYENSPFFVSKNFHISHAGNGTICLSHKYGQDYLLFANIYEMQGEAMYDYAAIYLDDVKGIIVEDGDGIQFAVDEETHEDWESCMKRSDVVPQFKESMQAYIEDAIILLSMDIDNSTEAMASSAENTVDAKIYFENVWKRTY